MKQIIILLLLTFSCSLFAQTVDTGNGIIISTNTDVTEEAVVENINIAKEIIDKWKTTATIIKNASNKLVTVVTLLPGILLLLLGSIQADSMPCPKAPSNISSY